MSKPHHIQKKLCYNRVAYRDPCRERAVKVYTINQESKYLLIQGVPATGVAKELVERCAVYGTVEEYRMLDEYPHEEFTEVYWVKFQRLVSARFAKKKLDDISFFGGVLHVCYAPEYESVSDTREKLNERKRTALRKVREYDIDGKQEGEGVGKKKSGTVSQTNENAFSLPEPPVEDALEASKCQGLRNPHFFDRRLCSERTVDKGKYPIFSNTSCTVPTIHTTTESAGTLNQEYCQIHSVSSQHSQILPRIATKNATLPVELQNLSAAEVYPAYYKEKYASVQPATSENCQIHCEMKPGSDNTILHGQPGSLSVKTVHDPEAANDREGVCTSRKRKYINCDVPVSKVTQNKAASISTDAKNYSHYASEPGAWDPHRERRRTGDGPKEEESDELSNTVMGIREKLSKSAEPSSKKATLIYQETDPLQGSGAQLIPRIVAAKRKNDGRKRI